MNLHALSSPYDPPLPAAIGGRLPSIPQLWERARHLFCRVMLHVGSTADFSRRWRLSRTSKKEVLGWLEPVEKLARSCLLVRVLGFLLMTPQGLKLLRETPKMAMPAPKKPDSTPPRITRIPIWHTVAPMARAMAERQKLEEQKAAERAARDRHDPENWGGGFRVIGWSLPDDHKRAPPGKKMPQWAALLRDSLDPDPIGAYHTRHPPREVVRETDPPALILARRIETLARVLENPAPAVMRLARYIAKLPREALQTLKDTASSRRSHWRHGADDSVSAAAHVRRAASVFCFDSS
jgi:hypothetical protein